MRLGYVDDKPKLDLPQEEEEEMGHHLPLWNAHEEQILMIIWYPVSPGRATGVEDASQQKGD